MRKFIKKIAVAVTTFAFMAATVVGGFATSVKADETIDTTMHIIVKGQPAGTDQIALNIWGGAWVDTTEWPKLNEVTTALDTWGWGNTWAGKIDMTKDAAGMYTCTVKYSADQYADNTDNHGIQIFMYGADNAAVAVGDANAFFTLAGNAAVTDIYVTVDYTNAVGADGATASFSSEAPVVDDGNTDDGSTDDGNTDDGNTGAGDIGSGDVMMLVVIVAAAAVAVAFVAGRKIVRE